MVTPATVGDTDVIEALASMMEDYLQAQVNTLITAAGVSWSLSIGEVLRGQTSMSTSRPNSVNIWGFAHDIAGQLQNRGAGLQREGEFLVECSVGDADSTTLDARRTLVADAIRHVVLEYWRVHNTACISILWTRVERDRSRANVRGLLGGPPQDTIDPVRVAVPLRYWAAQSTRIS